MASILQRVGADKVIDPEGASGLRSARLLMSSSFLDFFQVDDNIGMAEIRPKPEWEGKTLRQLNLRKKYSLNVVAVKNQDGTWKPVNPADTIHAEESLLIIAEQEALEKISLKTRL